MNSLIKDSFHIFHKSMKFPDAFISNGERFIYGAGHWKRKIETRSGNLLRKGSGKTKIIYR